VADGCAAAAARDIISANIASRGKSFKLTPTAQHRESLQHRAVFVHASQVK